jgi:DMSO/TMAO reductase YedYZ molybdopterin-dependent catalytic subunit
MGSSSRALLLFVLVLLAGCAPSPKSLDSVEVRDYQGQRLSSSDNFRENSIKGPQDIDIDQYRLKVSGMVETPRELSYDEVLALPGFEKIVTLHCVEGWDATILWRGALVTDLIGDTLPGASTTIFHAADGYTTSLPLDYLETNKILLAYGMNNITLPKKNGFPLQLVAEDKWGYKWIRWVTEIEVTDDAGYRGYWESRGYNNDGNLSGNKFEVQKV